MTATFFKLSQTVTALIAAVLIGFTFIAAAAGPAVVTGAANSGIVA